jgi:hypothetical protein
VKDAREVLDLGRRLLGQPIEQRTERADAREGIATAARGRHDRRQRGDALRVLNRHRLRDHSAHRGTHDVKARVTEVGHDAERIPRHVLEGVRGREPEPEQRTEEALRHVGYTEVTRARRLSRVAVVEPDDLEATFDEAVAELRVPHRARHRVARDEQERLPLATNVVGHVEVVDPNGACLHASGLRHPFRFACLAPNVKAALSG